MRLKDDGLLKLSKQHNVAQFASFGPDGALRHFAVRGVSTRPANLESAVHALFERSLGGSVNIRCFKPQAQSGQPFAYGLKSIDDILTTTREFHRQDFFTIINETVDQHDGGVSGVVLGDLVEFAPDATPRAVEGASACSLDRTTAERMLSKVYSTEIRLPPSAGRRIEFSVHPLRRGIRSEHVIVWQEDSMRSPAMKPAMRWPNAFSTLIGDKAFGLLVADLAGAPVPLTTVVGRRVAPFRFGTTTGSGDYWMRTAPKEPQPGRFSSSHGWSDPFALLEREDRAHEVASVLAQEGVMARHAGALLTTRGGRPLIEGVRGYGADFMLGLATPRKLPKAVVGRVRSLWSRLRSALGPVRVEWVDDGKRTWVVQLHRGISESTKSVIFPGKPRAWRQFETSQGLEALRSTASEIAGKSIGLRLVGDVGITSHLGDVLRRLRIPSVLIRPAK